MWCWKEENFHCAGTKEVFHLCVYLCTRVCTRAFIRLYLFDTQQQKFFPLLNTTEVSYAHLINRKIFTLFNYYIYEKSSNFGSLKILEKRCKLFTSLLFLWMLLSVRIDQLFFRSLVNCDLIEMSEMRSNEKIRLWNLTKKK